MKAIRDWVRRQWCRSGLHRWNPWSGLDEVYQWRQCDWCNYGQARDGSIYSIGEILMEFAKRKVK